MAYHDDLLQHALDLVHKDPANPAQADLRRSVSAAYYALFHLLISENVAHWNHDDSRAALARMIEHKAIASASNRILDPRWFSFKGNDPAVVAHLKEVAEAFGQLQNKRQVADYDNGTDWTHTDALREVTTAAGAFLTWQSIKTEKIAQDYIVSLLIKPRG